MDRKIDYPPDFSRPPPSISTCDPTQPQMDLNSSPIMFAPPMSVRPDLTRLPPPFYRSSNMVLTSMQQNNIMYLNRSNPSTSQHFNSQYLNRSESSTSQPFNSQYFNRSEPSTSQHLNSQYLNMSDPSTSQNFGPHNFLWPHFPKSQQRALPNMNQQTTILNAASQRSLCPAALSQETGVDISHGYRQTNDKNRTLIGEAWPQRQTGLTFPFHPTNSVESVPEFRGFHGGFGKNSEDSGMNQVWPQRQIGLTFPSHTPNAVQGLIECTGNVSGFGMKSEGSGMNHVSPQRQIGVSFPFHHHNAVQSVHDFGGYGCGFPMTSESSEMNQVCPQRQIGGSLLTHSPNTEQGMLQYRPINDIPEVVNCGKGMHPPNQQMHLAHPTISTAEVIEPVYEGNDTVPQVVTPASDTDEKPKVRTSNRIAKKSKNKVHTSESSVTTKVPDSLEEDDTNIPEEEDCKVSEKFTTRKIESFDAIGDDKVKAGGKGKGKGKGKQAAQQCKSNKQFSEIEKLLNDPIEFQDQGPSTSKALAPPKKVTRVTKIIDHQKQAENESKASSKGKRRIFIQSQRPEPEDSSEDEEMVDDPQPMEEKAMEVYNKVPNPTSGKRKRLSLSLAERNTKMKNPFDDDSEAEEEEEKEKVKAAATFFDREDEVVIDLTHSPHNDNDLPDLSMSYPNEEGKASNSCDETSHLNPRNRNECVIRLEPLKFLQEMLQCIPCNCASGCVEHATAWVAEKGTCYQCRTPITDAQVVLNFKL